MTHSSNRAFLALLMLAGLSLLAFPAYAGKTDMQTLNVAPSKKTDAPVKADYKTLESRGFFTSASEGGLGKDLWKGMKRSELIPLLEDMPVQSQDPIAQRLIFGALLTQTDAAMIEDDVPPEPGRDLLTIRLEKLIQAGAYQQAQDLYSSFDDIEPYHEYLARAGILSMMLNGEKSLACVEAETLKDSFAESQFIPQILAFCDVTLSETPTQESRDILAGLKLRNLELFNTKGTTLAYNAERFGELSLIERAFLISDKRITFQSSGAANEIQKIPPTDIRALLTLDNLSAKDRFMLTSAAESWGLAMAGELKDVYKAALPPAGGDPSTFKVADTAEDWEKIALYHVIANNAEDDAAQWDAIKKGLSAGRAYGIGAIKPYADLVAKAQPMDATVDQLETGIKLLNAAGKPIPGQWSERIMQIPLDKEKTVENQRVYALQSAVLLAKNQGSSDLKTDLPAASDIYPSGSRSGYLLKNIIENIDKPADNSDNAFRIYEKDYGLTFKQDYVMPSTVVWNHLLEASQRRNTGETVLLSASVLQAADLGKIYPGLLNDVRDGLNNVGLTDISSDLAVAAVLGSTQEN